MSKEIPSNGHSDFLKQEQSRIIRNLKRKVKDAVTRGYIFLKNVVGKGGVTDASNQPFEMPTPVPNPTQDTVDNLKDLNANLYDHAIWVDPDFDPSLPEYQDGEHPDGIWGGNEGRAVERSRASRKGAETKRRNRALDDPEDSVPHDNPQPPPDEPVWEPIFDTVRAYIARLEHEQGDGAPWVQDVRERCCSYMSEFFENKLYEHYCAETLHQYAAYLQENAKELSSIVDAMLVDSDDPDVMVNAGKFVTILNEGPLSLDQWSNFTDFMHGGYG